MMSDASQDNVIAATLPLLSLFRGNINVVSARRKKLLRRFAENCVVRNFPVQIRKKKSKAKVLCKETRSVVKWLSLYHDCRMAM
jgi:hypothetical protein